jgi:hypothetical protein
VNAAIGRLRIKLKAGAANVNNQARDFRKSLHDHVPARSNVQHDAVI